MKPFFLSLGSLALCGLCTVISFSGHAQSVGIGTATPAASAALEVRSTTGGVLVPRLSQAQRTAIAAPATGLLVFQTDGAQAGFWFNAGPPATPAWTFINPTADNLGNHTATQNLNLQANALTGTGASLGTAVGLGVRADGGLNLGQNTNGNNIFMGYQAGRVNTTGSGNQFSGLASGFLNTTGSQNLFSGYQSGYNNADGNVNQFVGYQGGFNTTSGDNNLFVGYQAGAENVTGSNNWAFGYGAGPVPGGAGTNLTNAGALGYQARVSQSNSLVLGGTGANAVRVGIGTTAPDRPLTVQAAPGSVELLSLRDNAGAARWHWNLAGDGLNLAQSGVTDYRLFVSSAGNVGLGTPTPSALLDVNGTARLRGLTTAGVVTTDANGNLSSAPAAGGADNLGNHTATQTLALGANALTGTGASLPAGTVGVGVRADGGLNLGQHGVGNSLLLGFEAGQALAPTLGPIQGGLNNQFVGYQAGRATTTGSRNHFNGYQSGQANTTGGNNQFVGYQAGQANTTGSFNQFSGYLSGFANTTGRDNQFSGYLSGFNNTTGSRNQFSGQASGASNTTGGNNQFSGYRSGAFNTEGSFNQFSGNQAGQANTTGSNNQFSGYSSGFNNTTGNNNQFSGYQSGRANTTGGNNQFSGYESGLRNTTGNFNQFIGLQSGAANTTGSRNQFIGYQSGRFNTEGNNNTALGYQATVDDFLTNATAIGYQARVSEDNSLVLGGTGANGVNVGIGTTAPALPLDVATSTVVTSGTYTFYANGGTGTNTTIATSIRASGAVLASQFNAVSDVRLKTVLGLSDRAADLVLLNKLRITDYTMRDRAQYGTRRFKKVIAQEVEAVYPQAVSQRRGFVPDLYQRTRLTAQPGDSLLRLPLAVPTGGVARGQRLKLVLPNGAEVVTQVARAAAAGEKGLLLRRAAGLAAGEVFAFGLEHADVRAVDYEALSMLNVSATQALATQVRELQAQNAALRQQAAAATAQVARAEAQATAAATEARTATAALLRRLEALEALGARASR